MHVSCQMRRVFLTDCALANWMVRLILELQIERQMLHNQGQCDAVTAHDEMPASRRL